MLVLDDSLQIKINSSKYFGLKFAATGPSYQFNTDSFVRLLDEKNYTEWLVPKTGGTFTGNIRIKGNIIFGEDATTTSWGIGGCRYINLKNSTHNNDGERFIYTDPQDPTIVNNNNNVIMCANGEMWISGGEGANTLYQYLLRCINNGEEIVPVENEGLNRTSEYLYLIADSNIYFESNCKNGDNVANRKCMVFNTAGNLLVPTNTTATKKVRNIAYQNGGTVSTIGNGDIVLVY